MKLANIAPGCRNFIRQEEIQDSVVNRSCKEIAQTLEVSHHGYSMEIKTDR